VQEVIASGDRGASRPVWEMVYNHYVNRRGLRAPELTAAVMARRPESGPDPRAHPSTFDQPGWGTLTFARPVATGGGDARPHLGPVGDGTYRLVAVHSGMALDVDGVAVVQRGVDSGSASQDWRLTHVGGGQYSIAASVSGRSLAVEGGVHGGGGLVLAGAPAGNSPEAYQRFAFIPLADDCWRIVPAHSGQSLDVERASRAAGARVVQFATVWTKAVDGRWSPASNQQWRLVKAAGVPRQAPSLRVVARPGGVLHLEWTAAPGATGYTVKRSWSSEGPFRIVATGLQDTRWEDAAPGSEATWHYRVAAVNRVGEGADSPVVAAEMMDAK
jgi:Ricin-type beta-trefoil lectin domain-like